MYKVWHNHRHNLNYLGIEIERWIDKMNYSRFIDYNSFKHNKLNIYRTYNLRQSDHKLR